MLKLRVVAAAVIFISGRSQLKANEPFTCPVTKASKQTFVPPSPGDTGWLGTEKLRTRIEYWEHWRTDELGYFVPKIAWFGNTFDWTPERWPHERLLTITGR